MAFGGFYGIPIDWEAYKNTHPVQSHQTNQNEQNIKMLMNFWKCKFCLRLKRQQIFIFKNSSTFLFYLVL